MKKPKNFGNVKDFVAQEKGITLVSLSVTMIVLVILAGITIGTLSGDNGLVTEAERIEANSLLAEQEAQELINTLKSEEKYTEDGTVILGDENAPTVNSISITEFALNSLKASFRININVTETGAGIDKIEYSVDDGETYVMPVENMTSKTYKFEKLNYSKQYNVKVKITDKNGNETIASQVVDSIKIGDYVDYTYDTVSTGYSLLAKYSGYDSDQTVTQSATTLKWRVLNVDTDTQTVDLVSENPTDNTVYFQGALGYNNGVLLLNDMCAKLYSNSTLGITARSINLVDMERHLTTDGFTARNNSEGAVKYGTTKLYEGSYRQYPNLYASQPGAGINLTDGATVTQPNIDGIVDPYNESAEVYTTPTTETSGQASTSGLTVTQTYYYRPINEANYGPAAAVLSNSNYYWVASRYVGTSSSFSHAGFGLRYASTGLLRGDLFTSFDYILANNFRLRPVVQLSSSFLSGTKDAAAVWQIKQ